MKELTIEALVSNLDEVIDFVNEQLEAHDCPMKEQIQLDVAVEELFVNIASYAYNPDITLSADERQIGGLGIFMVKKSMDEVVYKYEDGKNILSIKKKI